MNTLRTLTVLITALIVVVVGDKLVFNQIRRGEPRKTSQKNLIKTQTPTPPPTPIPTLTPTIKKRQSSPTPTTKDKDTTTLDNFMYPQSKRISALATRLTLESTDDPQIITDWYKDKIKNLGMNTTAFVQTSTNGNILNKLTGASREVKVEIEIKKKSSESQVLIIVTLK